MKDEDNTMEKKNEIREGNDGFAVMQRCLLDNDFTQSLCSGRIATKEAALAAE